MLTRTCVGVVLAGSAVFLAGCGNGAAPEDRSTPPSKKDEAAAPPEKKAPATPAGGQSVKLHVKDMTERLKLV